jgi:alcohol dehydrogenase (cytochrome c)
MKPIMVVFGALMLIPAPGIAQIENLEPVTDEQLRSPDPADWLMWRRTYNAWGYSPLDQINRENVGTLQLAWSRGMAPGRQQATPLVYKGIMFLPEPGDVITALDAVSGDLLWKYLRDLPEDIRQLVSGESNRNIAIYKDLIYHSTWDAHVVAINIKTGAQVWQTKVRDYRDGIMHSSGPIVVGGIVVSPQTCYPTTMDSGRKPPADCFIVGLDAETGKILWRRNSVAQPGEPGDETWGGVPYESRWPASVWLTGSYDPELDLIYWGTGSSRPYPTVLQGTGEGTQLYTNSTLALVPDTGEIAWFFQHQPKSEWDLDHVFERILVETEVRPNPSAVPWINPKLKPGERRKVMTGIPGKTGIVWTLDRETGEFLWARETVTQNVYLGVDAITGIPTENVELRHREVGDERVACPSGFGGKNFSASAYSPLTHAMYYPLQNTCTESVMTAARLSPDVGGGAGYRIVPVPGKDNVGRIAAIAVSTGETLWDHEQRAATTSVATTGGGLLFGGDVNRRFRAYDQWSGEVLWETILGGNVGGFPISYSANGRQYIAVAAGQPSGLVYQLLSLTPEIAPGPSSNVIYVFALPQTLK